MTTSVIHPYPKGRFHRAVELQGGAGHHSSDSPEDAAIEVASSCTALRAVEIPGKLHAAIHDLTPAQPRASMQIDYDREMAPDRRTDNPRRASGRPAWPATSPPMATGASSRSSADDWQARDRRGALRPVDRHRTGTPTQGDDRITLRENARMIPPPLARSKGIRRAHGRGRPEPRRDAARPAGDAGRL